MQKFYLDFQDAMVIADECDHWASKCWICEMFYYNLEREGETYFLPDYVFLDEGIVVHLEQVLEREIILPFDSYSQNDEGVAERRVAERRAAKCRAKERS